MKFQHFIMMVVMVLASFRPCSATDIFFQTIDTKDGLGDNFVRDITRDTYPRLLTWWDFLPSSSPIISN